MHIVPEGNLWNDVYVRAGKLKRKYLPNSTSKIPATYRQTTGRQNKWLGSGLMEILSQHIVLAIGTM